MKEQPISPKEWVKIKNLSPEQIALIKEYLSVKSDYSFSQIGRNCCICDKQRSEDDTRNSPFHINHFNATCKEHRVVEFEGRDLKVAFCFNIEIVRKSLGFPPYRDYLTDL